MLRALLHSEGIEGAGLSHAEGALQGGDVALLGHREQVGLRRAVYGEAEEAPHVRRLGVHLEGGDVALARLLVHVLQQSAKQGAQVKKDSACADICRWEGGWGRGGVIVNDPIPRTQVKKDPAEFETKLGARENF